MKNRKYKITNNTMEFEGRTLYRIRALKDFSNIKKGDLGGWIQTEDNLSQEGYCWIYNNAKCMDSARIYDNSCMYDNSEMRGNSKMYDNSKLYDKSEMHDNSRAYDSSEMHGHSGMYGHSRKYGNSRMYENSRMWGNSKTYGNSEMHDYSKMHDYSEMHEGSKIYNNSEMVGDSEMWGNSILKGNKNLYGKLVSKVDKFIDIANPQQGRIVTGVLKNGKILYNVGCQNEITRETFVNRIYNEDGGIERNPHREEYLKIIDMIELYFSK